MISRKFMVPAVGLLILGLLLSAHAQFGGRGRGGRFSRNNSDYGIHQQEQEEMEKALTPGFQEDTFTFARLRFEGYGYRIWNDDVPEADLMLTYRVFQTTSLKLRPGLNFVDITTKELENNPFVYVAGSGQMTLKDDEVATLRRYLLNGGFMMAEDFWGDDQWHHFYEQIKRVFPDRELVLLPLEDRIFHMVFNFKKLPQVPSAGRFYGAGRLSYDGGVSYAELGHEPRFFGIFDNKHRMMVLVCHNNHFGDGWEHEGEDESYFDTFSEPMAYPMFINIVAYTATH